MHLLTLDNLRRHYGRLLALDTGQVTLAPGAVGLLGPNGAGKSTLLKIILGLLPPSSGRASVLGLDVGESSIRIRERVGYVGENDPLVPGLSSVEFVTLAGELSGMARKQAHRRAHEVLACLGVEESRYRKVETLSTGVRQRIQLAQALVHDPDLLVLDEPTNGLDPSGRRAMLDLIRSLHDDFGKSVILSSHLLEDVDRVCEAVIILDGGKVLAHGRIDVLRAHKRNCYRLRLTGDPADLVASLAASGVQVQHASGPGIGAETELAMELPPGFRPVEIFRMVRGMEGRGEAAPLIRALVPEEESLQEVFRRIVGTGEGGAFREETRAA